MNIKLIYTVVQKNRKSIFVVLLFFVLVLVNIVGHKFVDEYSLKFDLTENSLYQFSDLTVSSVRLLNSPIKITVFNREEDYVVMLREVLKRYSSLNRNITLEFIDPLENPTLVDYYASKGVQVHQDDIIVEGSVRIKAFSIKDMYILNASGTSITGLNAEQQLTSAIFYVNDPVIPVVGFTDGHNERPSNALLDLFKDNNFDIVRGNMNGVLGDNPDILVISAPSRDFLPGEVELLEEYMDRGGNALLFVEPAVNKIPQLEGFINNRGIAIGEELIFEEKAFTGGNPINIVPMYAPHGINRYFMETKIFLTMPSTGNLYALPRPGSAYDIRTVLNSTPSSYGKSGYQFSTVTREPSDTPGPFSVVMSSEKKIISEPGVSRLIIAGSKSMYSDDLMGFSSYGNSEFIVQMINWLGREESTIHIPSKSLLSEPLNILNYQIVVIGLFITGVIPLLFLVSGVIIFIKRRRL